MTTIVLEFPLWSWRNALMPVGNARSGSPRRDRSLDDPAERWTMPLGRLAGTRLGLSYTVFFAAAVLFAVVLTFSAQPNNPDRLRATGLGTAFWVSGWLVQALTYFAATRLLGLRLSELSVGWLGVESASRNWSASRTLIVSLGTLTSVLLLGSFYRLVEGGFQVPVLSQTPNQPLTAPSIGFQEYDSIWRSGAWLCWVQALCQMYPLPRTMGRQIVGGLCGIAGRRFDLSIQTSIFRRCVAMIALLTLVLAVVLMSGQAGRVFPQWPLLALLGVLLWFSSRGSDIAIIMVGFESAREGEGVISRIRDGIQSRQDRKRVLRALEQERSEAVDATRLDEILNQLHRDGVESLGAEDRKILERVSKNLRQQRQAESDSQDQVGE